MLAAACVFTIRCSYEKLRGRASSCSEAVSTQFCLAGERKQRGRKGNEVPTHQAQDHGLSGCLRPRGRRLSVAGAAVLFNGSINGPWPMPPPRSWLSPARGRRSRRATVAGHLRAEPERLRLLHLGLRRAFTTDTLTVGNALAGSACKFVVEVFSADPSTVVQDITWANTGAPAWLHGDARECRLRHGAGHWTQARRSPSPLP